MIVLWFLQILEQSKRNTQIFLSQWRQFTLWYSLFPQIKYSSLVYQLRTHLWHYFLYKLMFNHTKCNHHLFKINIAKSTLYTCGILQSPDYILFVCPNDGTSIRHFTLCKLGIRSLHDRNILHILLSHNLPVYFAFFSSFKSCHQSCF